MATSLNEIYKAVGELNGTVRALSDQVVGLRRDMQESETLSASSRANVHRRLDEVVDRLAPLESGLKAAIEDVSDVRSDVADVKTVTDEVTRWRLMGIGALGVTGIAAAALASVVTAYWGKIVRALTGT